MITFLIVVAILAGITYALSHYSSDRCSMCEDFDWGCDGSCYEWEDHEGDCIYSEGSDSCSICGGPKG